MTEPFIYNPLADTVTDTNNKEKKQEKRGRKRKYFSKEEWRAADREHSRKWRSNNPEKFKESKKRWYNNNKDKIKQYNDRHRANMTEEDKLKANEYARNYWKRRYYSDPAFKQKAIDRVRERRQRDRESKEKGLPIQRNTKFRNKRFFDDKGNYIGGSNELKEEQKRKKNEYLKRYFAKRRKEDPEFKERERLSQHTKRLKKAVDGMIEKGESIRE